MYRGLCAVEFIVFINLTICRHTQVSGKN